MSCCLFVHPLPLAPLSPPPPPPPPHARKSIRCVLAFGVMESPSSSLVIPWLIGHGFYNTLAPGHSRTPSFVTPVPPFFLPKWHEVLRTCGVHTLIFLATLKRRGGEGRTRRVDLWSSKLASVLFWVALRANLAFLFFFFFFY